MSTPRGRDFPWVAIVAAGLLFGCAAGGSSGKSERADIPPPVEIGGSEVRSTVRAVVQMRPGGPVEEVEMPVHAVPVEPPAVTAEAAGLEDDELVLGVLIEGKAMAYPIRYLSLYEVINDRIAETPLTPTW